MTNLKILKEIEENFKELRKLVDNQTFCVGDAERFAQRYFNICRCVENIEISRNKLKEKNEGLKLELAILKLELKGLKNA